MGAVRTRAGRGRAVPWVLAALVAMTTLLPAVLVLLGAVVAVWGATLGIGGLVFEPLFGFAGTDPGLGLLSFVFLVALGVDYGIFLMHRMREEPLAPPGRECPRISKGADDRSVRTSRWG